MHKQKAISIVLQINNTVQKNQNSRPLVKSQYHVNSSTADGTTTSLTEHFVSTRLTETLVATWHQRDACVTLSHEADLAAVVVDSCCILYSCAGVGTIKPLLIDRNSLAIIYVVKLRLAFHTSSFPRFPVLRLPFLLHGATFSSLAFSVLAFSAPPVVP